MITAAVIVAGSVAAALLLALAVRLAGRAAIAREARRLAGAGVTRALPGADSGIGLAAAQAPCLCSICRSALDRFDPLGAHGGPGYRADARCPHCGSLERHRLAWLYLLNATDLFDSYEQKSLLYLSGEPPLLGVLAEQGTPAALDVHDAQLDDGRLPYPPDTFDVVYCCHVLERQPDDRRVMRELHRVLKPTGWVLLQAPGFRDRTEELDATAAAARGVFRIYGTDLERRLSEAGFTVRADPYAQRLGQHLARRHGLRAQESVYYLIPADGR